MQQAELFAPAQRITTGMLNRQLKFDLARSEQVKAETLAVYLAHPGEFIWFNAALLAVKHKYDLGAYFSATIRALHHEGKLESRNVYYGAERPGVTTDMAGKRNLKKGEKAPLPYLGYRVEFKAREAV